MTEGPTDHSEEYGPGSCPPGGIDAGVRLVLDTATSGMCLADLDGTLRHVNSALCALLGYSAGDLLGRALATFAHPDDSQDSSEVLDCLLSGERHIHRSEGRYLRQDGQVVWAEVSTTLRRDPRSRPLYLITQIQDVTDRKRAEAELRRAQRLLADLINHTPTPIYATELDARYRFVNPAWQAVNGIDGQEAVGRTVGEVFGPARAEEYEAGTRPVRETGGRVTLDESGFATGRMRHFHTVRFPILDDAGEVEAVGSISMDLTEQREAEQEARERSQVLDSILAASPVGISLSRNRQVVWANEAMATICGQSLEEHLRLAPRCLYPSEEEYRRVGEALYGGPPGAETRQTVTSWQRGDGTTISVLLKACPLAAGDPAAGYLVTASDITASLRHEQELQASLERYRGLVDAVSNGVVVCNREGVLIDANGPACDLLGVRPEELAGLEATRPDWRVVHEDGSPFAEDTWPSSIALRTGQRVRDVVLGLYAPEATECRWLLVNCEPRFEAGSGEVEAVVATITDITDSRRAQEALRESEERYRTAFEDAPTGLCLTALDGTILRANRAYGRMLGYAPEGLPGVSVVSLTHPDDAPTTQRWLQYGPDSARYPLQLEKRFLHRDGHTVWASVSTSLLRDSQGRPLHYVSQLIDITERKQAEQALRESERRFQEMTDLLPDMVFELDRDLRVTYVNRAVSETLGYLPSDLDAQSFVADVLDEATRARAALDLANAQAGRWPLAGTYDVRRKDGLFVPTEVHLMPREDADGTLLGYRGVLRDITDRQRAEAALRESEERFRTAFVHAVIGMTITGVDRRFLEVNEAFCRMLGYSAEELMALGPLEVTHPEDRPATKETIRCLLAGESEAEYLEKRYVQRDGSVVWAEVSAFLVRDAAGAPLHFITHQRDITGRRRAAEALQASERRFRELADLLPDMVFELSPDFHVTYINRAVADVLGYAAAELRPDSELSDIMDEATLARVKEDFTAGLTPGRRLVGTYELRRRDGTRLPVECHTMAVLGPAGELLGYRGALRDITDRRKAEAAERLAALGQLASGVAHEFNNLLAAMMLQAEFATQEGSLEQHAKLAELVFCAGLRGGDVCRNLMAFARPGQQRREHLQVEAALEAALAVAARQTENAQITVARHYDTAGRGVYADPRQLEEVFLNLVINACHAMPRGGTLTLATRHVSSPTDPGEIIVTISDTGSGIRPEHLQRVFEPFFTTKGLLGSGEAPGTGLGLSVSLGIVKGHGGSIEVTSAPDAGATFRVILPAVTADAAPAPGAPLPETVSAASSAGRRCARVLVAEDLEALLGPVRRAMAAEGHEVVCAGNTREALAALRDDRFDLVITDLVMPGGGGREVLAAATALPAPPAVLVITGLLEEEIEAEVRALGAADVLRKPFTSAQLAGVVQGLLARAGGGGGDQARA